MSTFEEGTEEFYKETLNLLAQNSFPFLVGGGLAVREYVPEIGRPMKDLDIFCKAGDYPKILTLAKNAGYRTSIPDERWLAKIKKNGKDVDLIFSSPNYLNSVDDSWFKSAPTVQILDSSVKILTPEDLIWCKTYIQDRTHYDGADINHLILNRGKQLDWKRLLLRMESHWELLFAILLNFRFIYPSERGVVPKWLMKELASRLEHQLDNPIPKDKICRGPLLSRTQYEVDILEKGFKFAT